VFFRGEWRTANDDGNAPLGILLYGRAAARPDNPIFCITFLVSTFAA
jgi:hypothetical protein